MKRIGIIGGHLLLAMGAMMAAGVAVAPTEVEEVMHKVSTQQAIDTYREASLRDIYEGESLVQLGDEPIAPTQNPLIQRVVTLKAREEDFDYYLPVKRSRQRYNRRKTRAARNGWRC